MIIDFTLLVAACFFAYFFRRFTLALLFIIGLVVFEMVSTGGVRGSNCWFLVASIFAMLLMIKEDSLQKGDASVFVRYNPYSLNNKLPMWVRCLILGVFLLAYLVRFIVVFF